MRARRRIVFRQTERDRLKMNPEVSSGVWQWVEANQQIFFITILGGVGVLIGISLEEGADSPLVRKRLGKEWTTIMHRLGFWFLFAGIVVEILSAVYLTRHSDSESAKIDPLNQHIISISVKMELAVSRSEKIGSASGTANFYTKSKEHSKIYTLECIGARSSIPLPAPIIVGVSIDGIALNIPTNKAPKNDADELQKTLVADFSEQRLATPEYVKSSKYSNCLIRDVGEITRIEIHQGILTNGTKIFAGKLTILANPPFKKEFLISPQTVSGNLIYFDELPTSLK